MHNLAHVPEMSVATTADVAKAAHQRSRARLSVNNNKRRRSLSCGAHDRELPNAHPSYHLTRACARKHVDAPGAYTDLAAIRLDNVFAA